MVNSDKVLLEWAIPFIVFSVSIIISFLAMELTLKRIAIWTKGQKWPATDILYSTIKAPIFIFCLVLSAFLGIITSPVTEAWKSILTNSLWTVLTLALASATLVLIHKSISFISQRLDLPSAATIFKTVVTVILGLLVALIVLSIWGLQTTPFLIFIFIIALITLLTMREAAPDYFAAIQIAIWEHIRLGETIKLQDGQQGVVTKLGWHNVEIFTPGGDTLFVPNSKITKQIITKFNQSPEAVKVALDFFTKQTATTLKPDENKLGNLLASTLSKREMEIAELVSRGASNKELAKQLFITENTVKVHIKNILLKLELKNRQQLAVMAASHIKKSK
jgi:DNA-binding CsgD family transcriptional regulator/small-conductance mechanosensitive channel